MTTGDRPRLLYYCQSLVGLGHLTASINIIKELLVHFDVDLIYGGISYPSFPRLYGFRVLELPSLLLNESGELYDPQLNHPLDIIWQQRLDAINSFLNPAYRGIVLEFYPFGRRKFKNEIRALCKQVRDLNGNIPVFSQVREILVPTDPQSESLILDILNKEIHTVLVRGDPDVVRLEETFSLAGQLENRLFYGGYVTPPPLRISPQRQNKILVSQGGGNVGMQLLQAAIQVAALIPEYQFILATGSSTSEHDIEELQASVLTDNVVVVPFLEDFRKHLSTAALSINMGGDNTLLDVIATKTPSLAFPYPGNSEQTFRIEKLAKHGWISPLSEQELSPEIFKAHIENALKKYHPHKPINLNGALNISNKIKEILATYPV